jgi:putative transposase
MVRNPFRSFKTLPEIIQLGVMMCARFPLSLRNVEDLLHKRGIEISMDGRGARKGNVFVERLWRSIKYEEIYLRAYASVPDARAGISRYITFYNTKRPHSSLDRQTPNQAYFNPSLLIPVAA